MDADTIRHVSPLRDVIIVEVPHPKETLLKTGIYLPPGDKTAEKNVRTAVEGKIVAVGPGRLVGKVFVRTNAKVGQRIMFANHSAEEIPQDFGTTSSSFFWMHDDEAICEVIGEGEITGITEPLRAVKAA